MNRGSILFLLAAWGIALVTLYQNCGESNSGHFITSSTAGVDTTGGVNGTDNLGNSPPLDPVDNPTPDVTPPPIVIPPPQVLPPPLYMSNLGFKAVVFPPTVVDLKPGESIQTAIDLLASMGGGTVNLLAGTHVANGVRVLSNTIIQGQGKGQTLVLNNGPADGFIINSGRNFIIKNLTINATGNTRDAVVIRGGADNVLVSNLEVINPNFSGVATIEDNANDPSQDITYDNIIAAGGAVYNGLYMDGVQGGAITNCNALNNNRYGVYVRFSNMIEIGFNRWQNNTAGNQFIEQSTNVNSHDNVDL